MSNTETVCGFARPDDYPPHDDYRGGCKVRFHYYRDRATAEQASELARQWGRIWASQGYDTGYRVAGEINWSESRGMWEVVIP